MGIDYAEVLVATNMWYLERKGKVASYSVLLVVPFLLKVVEALNFEIKNLPLYSQRGIQDKEIDAEYIFTLGMFLQGNGYSVLRTILSLVGDIYNSTLSLKKRGNGSLLELKDPIERLFDSTNRFRYARNFFTHLDEVLTKMDEHGITGSAVTNCGIQYKEHAKGCVHLVWDDIKQTIHFTYCRKACQIRIEKSEFNDIFTISTK